MSDIYCPTYCNFGHRLVDGKPVGHECIIIPPNALKAEIEGNYHLASDLIQASRKVRHAGVRVSKAKTG